MYYNWYDPRRRQRAHALAGRPATGSTRSCPASTTAGSEPPCRSCGPPIPGAAPPGRAAVAADALGHVLLHRTRDGSPGRAHPRRVLRRARRRPGSPLHGQPHRHRPRRLVHEPPLRHHRVGDPDHHVSGIIRGQIPAAALLRAVADLPGDAATGTGRRCSRSAPPAPTSGSTSSRAPTPTGACTSSRAGAARCSRSSCPRLRAGGAVGAAARGASTTRCTCVPSVSTASTTPTTATGASRPSSNPCGGYREYGVDALGPQPRRLLLRRGEDQLRRRLRRLPRRRPTRHPTYGDGVVTPHASFLAMMHEPREAFHNLLRIQYDLDAYGRGGFFDAVAVKAGTVARRYLSLDQAMIMGAIGQRPRAGACCAARSAPARSSGGAAGHRDRGVRRRPA